MNQTVNITKAVRTLFNADATLSSLVPGGLIYGIQPAPVLRPFASLLVYLDGDPELTTGAIYAQAYMAVIRVWSDQFLAKAGAIQTALEGILTSATKLTGLTDNAWTLAVWPQPSSIEEQEQRLFGQFNFVAGARWLIQLQEQRS